MAKIDKTLPLENKHIRSMLHSWRHIPYDALKDILSWEYIRKSPCSFSFYNKKKDWNYTEEGTIRISDHWNFYAPKRGRNGNIIAEANKIHSITNIPVEEGVWYRGDYDHLTDTFVITKNYGKSTEIPKEQLLELKYSVPKPEKIPYPTELIEIKRNFTENIKKGSVFVFINGEYRLVTKLSRSKINYQDNDNLICVNSNSTVGSWFTQFPDFMLRVNDKEYTKELLLEENLI